MKRQKTLLALLALLLCAATAQAGEEATETDKDRHGVMHTLLFYVPNRFLDVFDMVRARVRLGPGLAVGVRATEWADVHAGTYLSVYAGLPGPRQRKMPHLPFGVETLTGIEVSVADLATGAGLGPDYSPTEIGLGFQALIVGIDIGIDPVEIVDLLGGFFLWDPRHDDF